MPDVNVVLLILLQALPEHIFCSASTPPPEGKTGRLRISYSPELSVSFGGHFVDRVWRLEAGSEVWLFADRNNLYDAQPLDSFDGSLSDVSEVNCDYRVRRLRAAATAGSKYTA